MKIFNEIELLPQYFLKSGVYSQHDVRTGINLVFTVFTGLRLNDLKVVGEFGRAGKKYKSTRTL